MFSPSEQIKYYLDLVLAKKTAPLNPGPQTLSAVAPPHQQPQAPFEVGSFCSEDSLSGCAYTNYYLTTAI